MRAEHIETVIVGGGQAGLSTGYHLARRGLPFVILEANERIGDSWRKRWDSLRLFTPARYSGLPGRRFPAPTWSFPGKDDVADYLEDYAAPFELPVRTGVRVDGLSRDGDRYAVVAGDRRFAGRPRRRGLRRVPASPDTRLRRRARSERRPDALQRVPPSNSASGRWRPRRGRRELGRRDRARGGRRTPDLAVGKAPGPGALPPGEPLGSAQHAAGLVAGVARVDRADADGAEGPGQVRVPRAPARPGQAGGLHRRRQSSACRGRRACATGCRCSTTDGCSRSPT